MSKLAVYDRGSQLFGVPLNWRAVEVFDDPDAAGVRCVALNKEFGVDRFCVAKYDGREVMP